MVQEKNRLAVSTSIIAVILVVTILVASFAAVGTLKLKTNKGSTTSPSSSSSTSRSYSSSSSSSVVSSSTQNSSPSISKFQGINSFLFDNADKVIFSVNLNNTISEINATTNSVINSSYFVPANKNETINGAFIVTQDGTLYVSATTKNSFANETIYVIQSGKLTQTIDKGYGPLLFATQNDLYFANLASQNSPDEVVTILDSANFNFVKNITSCTIGVGACFITGAFFDPVNRLAYVTIQNVGVDGGHSWQQLIINASTNSLVQGGSEVSNPSSFTFNPSNGTVFISSAWDESPLGYCEGGILPGANITSISGTLTTAQIAIMKNAGPTSDSSPGCNGGGQGGFSPSESGENDTLGGIAFDSANGAIYIANGTVKQDFRVTYLPTIVRVTSNGSLSTVANFQCRSVSALLYDPLSDNLYVSLALNSSSSC